jgi:hypothetical protein
MLVSSCSDRRLFAHGSIFAVLSFDRDDDDDNNDDNNGDEGRGEGRCDDVGRAILSAMWDVRF